MGEPVQISDQSRDAGENVWVRAVNLVNQYKPVNMGQGMPDFTEVVPQSLKAALIKTQSPDAPVTNNQYTRGQGNVQLVNELADIYSPLFKRTLDPMKEILVTVGGYESLHCCVNAVVNPGDEVVIIEPNFDSYGVTVKNRGAIAKFVTLKLKPGGTSSADITFDRDEMRKAFTSKTKAIIVNTPHNPTGKVFTKEEIEFIADLCKEYNCLYLSDEVYEWLAFDKEHIRAATLPGMWERTLTCCSAGKTFNVTGWKTGWTIGPEYLVTAAMKIHQTIIYTVPTPLQIALAETFKIEKQLVGTEHSYWQWLQSDLIAKRKRVWEAITNAGLKPITPEGGYFMMVDIKDFQPDLPAETSHLTHDFRVSEWLIKEKGLATIPLSAFYSEGSKKANGHYLRFCFIKGDKTLDAFEEKLKLL